MSKFLNHLDHDNILSFLNTNEQAHKLANKARDGTISQILTGKELLKQCLECKLRSDTNQCDIIDIDSVTNEIWDTRLKTSQKRLFASLAENVNKARNANTIELIARINTPQIAETVSQNSFFNGTKFSEDESFESLILPLGTIYRGTFQ
jgi:hypothetical protein